MQANRTQYHCHCTYQCLLVPSQPPPNLQLAAFQCIGLYSYISLCDANISTKYAVEMEEDMP